MAKRFVELHNLQHGGSQELKTSSVGMFVAKLSPWALMAPADSQTWFFGKARVKSVPGAVKEVG